MEDWIERYEFEIDFDTCVNMFEGYRYDEAREIAIQNHREIQ